MFLDQKAVEGNNRYQVSLGFSPQEAHALSVLVEKGWVKECQDHTEDGPAFQLTKAPLERVQINLMLQFPWNVFTTRADEPLENATCFELMLILKKKGWKEKNADDVKKKKSFEPLVPRAIDPIMSGPWRGFRDRGQIGQTEFPDPRIFSFRFRFHY